MGCWIWLRGKSVWTQTYFNDLLVIPNPLYHIHILLGAALSSLMCLFFVNCNYLFRSHWEQDFVCKRQIASKIRWGSIVYWRGLISCKQDNLDSLIGLLYPWLFLIYIIIHLKIYDMIGSWTTSFGCKKDLNIR